MEENMKFDHEETEVKNPFLRFFRNNQKQIVNLILCHVAICVFGLIVVIACGGLANKLGEGYGWITHVGGTIGALLYLALIYVNMWEAGAADKIKMDGGRLKRDNAHGIKVWLLASSPLILLTVLSTIFYFVWTNGSGVVDIILRFANGIYLNLFLIDGIPPFVMYWIIMLPGALVATLSYISGISGQKCIFPEKKKK